jgi:hypothetical protein
VPPTTPILIWSHIPIVSALAPLINSRGLRTNGIAIEAGHIHWDTVQILALLTKHPNVKACLSGHLHRIDHVELKGIHFYCNGAVSGAWWKGKNDGFAGTWINRRVSKARSTARNIASASIGFSTYSNAPNRMASTAVCAVPCPVMKMTATLESISRKLRNISNPEARPS